jgi:hypothetical protein
VSISTIIGGGDWKVVGWRLKHNYLQNPAEQNRRKLARERIDFYEDRADAYLRKAITDTFDNLTVQTRLKKFVPLALSNNLTKRIINAYSTVYIEPAKRKVDDEASQAVYDEIIEALNLHAKMRAANRYANLCNEVVLWPYLRASDGVLQLEVLTPDNLYFVSDPWHPKQLLALIIDQFPTWRESKVNEPHYLVVTPWETFNLDKHFNILMGTIEPNPLEEINAVVVHREEPMQGLTLGDQGGDLIAGHKSYALIEVLKLKEQKSGGKQPIIVTDDATKVTHGQARDDESILELPTGSSFSVADLAADPALRIKAQESIQKNLAAAYNIAPGLLDQSFQATSGYQLDLLRQPLREKRLEQVATFRRAEKQLAQWLARITGAFDVEGWNIDFGEFEAPMDPNADFELYKKRRGALLTNTLEQIISENPDLTLEQAQKRFEENLEIESQRIRMAQELNAAATAQTEEAGPGPEVNGRNGGLAASGNQPSAESGEQE